MDVSATDRRYDEAAAFLPARLRRPALALPPETKAAAEEFRLRTGFPASVLLRGEEYAFGGEEVRQDDLETVCNLVTEFSRYTATETLRRGYLTAAGGFRVGVCGTSVMEGGRTALLKNFSSMAIRIAREKKGLAADLAGELREDGAFCSTVLLAPPGFGKTTLLRDLVRCLSAGEGGGRPLRLALCDERGEVAACFRGAPQLDVGPRTDVLDACPKAEGIPILLRAMNPEVIAVDEITAAADLQAMEQAANAGVKLLATIHAASVAEMEQKPLFQTLRALRVFRRAVVITREDGARRYRVEPL